MTLLALFVLTLNAHAEMHVAVECKGRSFLHQIQIDPSTLQYTYVLKQFWGGEVDQFSVEKSDRTNPLEFLFTNSEHRFAMRATPGNEKIRKGDRWVHIGSGSAFRNDGFSNDMIRSCWLDLEYLELN